MARSEFTKQALARSFRKLVARKPLNKITVSAITDDCNVNRQTFYYHFNDIYDLIAWIYSKEVDATFGENPSYETWQQGLIDLLKFIEKNRTFVMKTIHAVDTQYAMHYLRNQIDHIVSAVSQEFRIARNLSKEDAEMISIFYGSGISGIIINWMDTGMKEKPEALVQRIERLLSGTMDESINRLAN